MNTLTTEQGGSVASARRVVLVTGLSGAGKASMLRVLEDLGYEAVDNPPLLLTEEMVLRGERPTAICVDIRSRGFDAQAILALYARLKRNAALRPELVFLVADESVLIRRFTETRRRHPLAPMTRVTDGIAKEIQLTAALRAAADLVIDTSDVPLPMLRRTIEQRFSSTASTDAGMTVSLISFAYPAGLPRDADLIFDARFLRNPHYDPMLRDRTGLDGDVAAYVEADPDFAPFIDKVTDLLTLLLPRFVQEGKKYASVAIGCTGGQHRSVHSVQVLAERLRALQHSGVEYGGSAGLAFDETGDEADGNGGTRRELACVWRVAVTHRELMRAHNDLARTGSAAHVGRLDPGEGGLKDSP